MARTLFQFSLDARCHLALSRVLRCVDADRATDHEIMAYEDAHTVGFNRPDAETPPTFFVGEDALLSAWSEGKQDARVYAANAVFDF
jgi:hypothetical protein